MKFHVYILYSAHHDKYYIGQTNDLMARLLRHNTGKSKYTASYRPWILLCSVDKDTRSEAMMLEKKIKNLSKTRIKNFIEKYK